MKGPLLREGSLRASYGLAEATAIGVALVLVDVARAHGFESGLETLSNGTRRVRVRYAGGVFFLAVCPEGVKGKKDDDIVLPHPIGLAIARLEGHLLNLEKEEGSRGNHSRLPSEFVGREEPERSDEVSFAA
ncbi:MAG: hypothetical protein CMQ40_10785 [Gammaproteobacteria bacterium]|nr:hypothetical protein [Gammaproteobacteria bacterium]